MEPILDQLFTKVDDQAKLQIHQTQVRQQLCREQILVMRSRFAFHNHTLTD